MTCAPSLLASRCRQSVAVAWWPKEKEVGSGAPHRHLGISAYYMAVKNSEMLLCRSNQRVQMTCAGSMIPQTWGPHLGTEWERDCGSASFHDTMVRTDDIRPVIPVPTAFDVDMRRSAAWLDIGIVSGASRLLAIQPCGPETSLPI